MDRSFVEENERERARLGALAGGATDEELGLEMEDGWTVAAALAHLAFWDQRALVLMRRWRSRPVAPSPIDQDVANGALLPLCLSIPARTAANLAVGSAWAVDHELESASGETIAAIAALGDRFRLFRADHRRVHLDAIEAFLKAKRGAGRPSGG